MEWEKNDALIYALYGLLMILPQSEAYATLQRRLAAIPPATKPISNKDEKSQEKTDAYCPFDFSELLKHFHKVQEQHKEQKRKQRLNSLVERNTSHIDM